MFVVNFGGIMALPTNLSYCLVYPNIYSSTVPKKDRHHFNVGGSPPRVHTHMCICHTLLQHANTSADHRQQHHGSHPVILQGVQYDHLFLKPDAMLPLGAACRPLHRGAFPLGSSWGFIWKTTSSQEHLVIVSYTPARNS